MPLFVFSILMIAQMGQNNPDAFSIPAKTSLPFTYCIGYLPDPEQPSFLEPLAESPPDLYHLGYQIPFKGALGPTYGHELYTNAILPPSEIHKELERIQRVQTKMREAGVSRLIPYVFTMAFFGNPGKRTGFFNFYDHWNDYADFDLGLKPLADPSLWSQVRGPNPLGGGPPDVFHYEPCVNHPGWSNYLDLVVRELAKTGYDGMFFDVNTEYCYCPHCQEAFDVYLLEKYGRDGLQEHFGTNDHRELNLNTIYKDFEAFILSAFKRHIEDQWKEEHLGELLGLKQPADAVLEEDWRLLRCYMQDSIGEFPKDSVEPHVLPENASQEGKNSHVQNILRVQFKEFLTSSELKKQLLEKFGSGDVRRRCLATPKDILLWVETQRFWCDSIATMFARLKKEGKKQLNTQTNPRNFYTVGNIGSMATLDGFNKRRVDGIDLVRCAKTADMQMFEEMHQPGMLESGVIFSNIFAFRWAMAAGTRAGTLLYKVNDDRAADLAHAESAAGGGGAFIQPGLAAPDSRKRWKQFFAEHADLFENGESYAKVAVLFWDDQVFYEYPEHLAMVWRLTHILSETQTPFDFVTQENAASLAPYDVVFAPCLRYLEDSQIQRLMNYAGEGGHLVIIEPFGTEDPFAQTRKTTPLDTIAAPGFGMTAVSHGKGMVIRLNPSQAPDRASDLWALMEERASAFVLARQLLNDTRNSETHTQKDLGENFIKQLENTLEIRLRWCPPNTDPGVYIHAYHFPAKSEQSEHLVIHVVNYHLPILLESESEKTKSTGNTPPDPIWSTVTRSGEPFVQTNINIGVPLPKGLRVNAIHAFSPTEPPATLSVTAENEFPWYTLDSVAVYQMILLELTREYR
ncbi:MAG TPA: beta-galactosidase trimerization domain-containing protein [Candidatus Hydrogenedentes bacterium]|nr:beta-galactosidase trimerization domain-containing protein [Candidatus Hydrogenedentota bacterium]